jgi:hypothetical protein
MTGRGGIARADAVALHEATRRHRTSEHGGVARERT